jgi:hypothetical protein
MLCEDANALEVTDEAGRSTIEKTSDRDQRERELREGQGSTQPTHPHVED